MPEESVSHKTGLQVYTTEELNRMDDEDLRDLVVPCSVKLQYPIDWGEDDQVAEVEFERRLKGDELMDLPAQNLKFSHMARLVSRLTGRPMSFYKRMDSIDLFGLTKVVSHFLPSSPKTGEDE